jgi:hypothetical protein
MKNEKSHVHISVRHPAAPLTRVAEGAAGRARRGGVAMSLESDVPVGTRVEHKTGETLLVVCMA